MPVRVAAPAGIGGLVDTILTPAYSTAVGLLQWGAGPIAAGEPLRYESAPARAASAGSGTRSARSFPEDTRALASGPGPIPGSVDLTGGLRAAFVEARATGCSRLRAACDRWARDHRAGRRLRRRPARGARPTAAARRPLAASPRIAGPRRGPRPAAARAAVAHASRSSTGGCSSGRGSRSRSSTRTATTRRGRSG